MSGSNPCHSTVLLIWWDKAGVLQCLGFYQYFILCVCSWLSDMRLSLISLLKQHMLHYVGEGGVVTQSR